MLNAVRSARLTLSNLKRHMFRLKIYSCLTPSYTFHKSVGVSGFDKCFLVASL